MLEGDPLRIRCIVATFFSIAFVTVCMRCYVRLRMVRCFGWDDAFMVLAMLIDIMFSTTAIAGTLHGFGRRFDELSPEETQTALKFWFLAQGAYIWVCITAKISISLLLLRIAVKKAHVWILYGVMVVTVVVGMTLFFILTLQCQPVSYFWNRMTQTGSCNPLMAINMLYVYSVTSAICDFTLGLLPIALLWEAKMNKRTKAAVVCILSMGCVASCGVVIRIPFIEDFKEKDFLYATSGITIWSHLEAKLGIIAGSLSTLRPLFLALRNGTMLYGDHSHHRQSHNSATGRSRLKKNGTFALASISGTKCAVNGVRLEDTSEENLNEVPAGSFPGSFKSGSPINRGW